jgi:ribosomal protein S18 acetylase RimI-like enzyme
MKPLRVQSPGAACFAPDAWLSSIFKRSVFALRLPLADAAAARKEMKELAAGGDAFFYAKVPTPEVRACIALADAGFRVIDTALTFAWRGAEAASSSDGMVGPATAQQLPAIPAIAARCFSWSRFHQDPQISASLANEIKRLWMESYLSGTRGAALYAADLEGQVAGFLGVVETNVHGRRIAAIDLMGVDLPHQGRGIGSALVRAFIADWRVRVSELRVGTQAANLRSIALYESQGFRMVESSFVLHAHLRNGALCR